VTLNLDVNQVYLLIVSSDTFANAKIASPKETACSGFIFGIDPPVDIRAWSDCHSKKRS
jgi:hypothetical protein